jgi:hypothetical protein
MNAWLAETFRAQRVWVGVPVEFAPGGLSYQTFGGFSLLQPLIVLSAPKLCAQIAAISRSGRGSTVVNQLGGPQKTLDFVLAQSHQELGFKAVQNVIGVLS